MKLFKGTDRITVLFIIYSVFLAVLLFCRTVPDFSGQGYLEQLRDNYSMLPFGTVKYFLRIIGGDFSLSLKLNGVVNLVGNVIMFIPLGLYLPFKFKRLEGFWFFFAVMVITICLVEGIQFFTLLGFCDIDDVILNAFGGAIGFAIYKISKKTKKSGTNRR